MEEFFFDEKSDSSRIAEYRRFRELTQSISANADAIRMGSDEFAKVVFMLDHYSRSNLWSEFFPIPPEEGDKVKKWRKVGESMVGEEPLDSQEKRNLDPSKFSSLLRELVLSDSTDLRQKIDFIYETEKMNPSALFAAQYAEAIKLRKGVDPVLEFYEDLRLAFLNNNPKEFNSAVASIKKASVDRPQNRWIKFFSKRVTTNSNPFTEVLWLTF